MAISDSSKMLTSRCISDDHLSKNTSMLLKESLIITTIYNVIYVEIAGFVSAERMGNPNRKKRKKNNQPKSNNMTEAGGQSLVGNSSPIVFDSPPPHIEAAFRPGEEHNEQVLLGFNVHNNEEQSLSPDVSATAPGQGFVPQEQQVVENENINIDQFGDLDEDLSRNYSKLLYIYEIQLSDVFQRKRQPF